MATKSIILKVPTYFETPSHIANATPEQVEHALKLADAFLETGITFTHDVDVKHLHDKIKLLQSTSVESMREEAVRIAKAELKAEVGGKDTLLSELRRQLDTTKERLDELKSEKSKLDERLHAKEQKIDDLQDKLQQRIAVQSNSSKRGLEGEKDFQIISSTIKDWKLESTGKTKESADFRAILHSVEVRFEIKNHKDKVPYTDNVDKFERDMKKHPSAKLGVFVALTACIEKMDDSITIRWTDNKQLLVFIPYFLTRDLSYTYDVIEGFVRTMKHMKSYLEVKDTSKDIELLTQRITDSIQTIQALDAQLDIIQSDHKEYNVKMLKNYTALKSVINSTLSALTEREQEEKKPQRKTKSKKKSEAEAVSD